MFSGLIEEKGKIVDKTSNSMKINAKKVLEEISKGDSISVNGVCLTVTEFDKQSFSVDVMPETLRASSLGRLKVGDFVNLERASKLSSFLGGHIVTGHVDCICTLIEKRTEENSLILRFNLPDEFKKYVIKKGSIAIDGISLTISNLYSESFEVSIIPHTAKHTTIGSLKIGNVVNVEFDVIGKYVERLLLNLDLKEEKPKSTLTKEFLLEHGFI
jgi:riboflavin synthase